MQLQQRIGLCLLALLLSACSGAQPYSYHANREAPSGPGLFTGTDETQSTPEAKE